MIRQQKLVGALAATALLMGSSALARRGTEKSWTAVAGKKPPTDDAKQDVDWREAIAWAVVSGAVVGLTRLTVRRKLLSRITTAD